MASYRWRDEELQRDVALKQIKEHFASDPESRSRFVVEAEITGGLEHPGIVPVYGLGIDGAGRPFYAMRFIKGGSLKDAIDRFHAADRPGRGPGERAVEFRKLLGRFIDVCEAVAYAHSRGVLHRDLKPANVMLGKYGETLVVDWGLAKVIGREETERSGGGDELTLRPSSGSDVLATLPGRPVGTPAYMSPEQASGRIDELGPATDVYSLGVTLYQLITGRLAFGGAHGREVIGRVRQAEFASPRQVKPDVPRALEAICLKAMALNPDDRYATPEGLAEDLEHWLADEPVSAYQEAWPQHLARLARRHRAASIAAAVTVLLISLVSTLSAIMINRSLSAQTQAKNEVQAQRQRAEIREQLAVDAVKKFRDSVANDPTLKDTKALSDLRKHLLNEPLRFFQTLHGQLKTSRDTGPEALSRLGSALFELAQTTLEIGSIEYAIDAQVQAVEIRERVVQLDPGNPRYVSDLAASLHNLAVLRQDTGKLDLAERLQSRAIGILERLTREHADVADYRSDLAKCYNNLGLLESKTSRQASALESYHRALAIRNRLARDHADVARYQAELASTYNNMALLQYGMGQQSQALASFQAVLEIDKRLSSEHPDETNYLSRLAGSFNAVGAISQVLKKLPEALAAYQDAVAIQRRIAQEHPAVSHYQSELAQTLCNLGLLQSRMRKPEESLALYTEALRIRERLAHEYPTVIDHRHNLARSHYNLGLLQVETDRSTALVSYRKAAHILQQLVRDHPEVSDYQDELGKLLTNMAVINMREGRWLEAKEMIDQAIGHERLALRSAPENGVYKKSLRVSLYNLSRVYLKLKQPADAARAARAIVALSTQEPEGLYDTACSLALCASQVEQAAPASPSEHAKYADEAMAALKQASAAGWDDWEHTAGDPDFASLRSRTDFQELVFDRLFPAWPFTP